MRRASWLLFCGVAWSLVSAAPAAGQARGAARAVASSALFQSMQATGKPALIIAGSTGCIYCRQMAEELATNRALDPSVRRMFVIKIDVASNDWKILQRTFDIDEGGVPKVFFVRADGKLLYGKAGKPADLDAFLKARLEEAGTLLDEKTLKLMARDGRLAELALKRKDYPKAIELLEQHGGSGSFAAAALTFERMGEKLVEQAGQQATAAVERLSQSTRAVGAALELIDLQARVAGHEPARTAVDAAVKTARMDDERAQLLDDAARLQAARDAESARRLPEAIEAYQAALAEITHNGVRDYAAGRVALLEARVK